MLEFILGYSAGHRMASGAASLARSAAAADGTLQTHRLEDANARIDRLAMIVRAIWALLEEQGMTADQLVSKIEELDLADGALDGAIRPQPVDCPSCDSKVAPGLDACQFCGSRVRNNDGDPMAGV